MRKKIFLSNKKGFTVIEAFAACSILAICLLSTGLAIYTQFPFINQNREKAIATLAAQEEIEKIRGLPFDAILAINPSWVAANLPAGFAYLTNPACAVTLDAVYGDSNIQRVSVTVSWSSTSGPTLQKTILTLISRNGINKQ
ncbi:MAG: hypothetical protein V1927_06805 [Candidatus Omnitrophota bacterium]